MRKRTWTTLLIIFFVVILSVLILSKTPPKTSKEITKCIGENSILYTQLGCHACEHQDKMFGENYQYLNVVDCFFEQDKCIKEEIMGTPTWIINGEKYLGAKSIEKLQNLTNCN